MSEVYTQDPIADTVPSSTERSTDFTIDRFPGKSGLKFCMNWLDQCLSELNNKIPDFGNLNDAQKGKLLFQRFLLSDMKLSCVGVLPKNVNTLHLVDLPGPYVLQVNKIDNINSRPEDMFQEVPSGIKRTLMLSMTDGVQCVYGVDHKPIKDLRVLAPAGLKVVIRNVKVRSGRLLLVPEGFEVLGGMVEDLEAERMKLVKDANPPLMVKRKRSWVEEWRPVGGDRRAVVAGNSTLQDAVSYALTREMSEHASISYRTWNSVSGVGEISVDNSYRLTGDEEIPSTSLRSLLSDWSVEKMDDGPISLSKWKEALQGLKEVEEGSSVPKKKNPELADKQLDGTPVVMNVWNAFPVDTTCELKKLQKMSDMYRFSNVRKLVDAVYDICFVLGMDFQSFIDEVHPNLTDYLEVRSMSINPGTLPKLAKAVEDLKNMKIERFEKLQDLATQLIDLWSFMDTSPEEKYLFDHVIDSIYTTVDEVNLHEALSLSSIENAELEVERLKLKASKMKVERRISHAHTGNHPEATRGKIIKPDQMIQAKVEAGSSKGLLDQVETWISSCISDGGWKNIIG